MVLGDAAWTGLGGGGSRGVQRGLRARAQRTFRDAAIPPLPILGRSTGLETRATLLSSAFCLSQLYRFSGVFWTALATFASHTVARVQAHFHFPLGRRHHRHARFRAEALQAAAIPLIDRVSQPVVIA